MPTTEQSRGITHQTTSTNARNDHLTFTDASGNSNTSILALGIRFPLAWILGRPRTLVCCSWLALVRPRAFFLPIRRFAFAEIRAYSVIAYLVLSTRFTLAFIDVFTLFLVA